LKQMKDKVTNFETQKKRIEKFVKLSTNKGNKADLFKPIMMKVIATGGANLSAPRCQGELGNPNVTNLTNLVSGLTGCLTTIGEACLTSRPEYDEKYIEDCAVVVDTFKANVEECLAKDQPGERCTCWKSQTLADSSNALANCDISTLNREIATFKKNCTGEFADCRKLEDQAAGIIFQCSPKSNPTYLLQQISGANLCKAALATLKTTVEEVARQSRRRRQAEVSCADFTSNLEKLLDMLIDNPAAANGPGEVEKMVGAKPTSCSMEEKDALQGLVSKCDEATEMTAIAIQLATERYKAIVGRAPTEEEIAKVNLE